MSRGAPIVIAVSLIAVADRIGDLGPPGPAAAVAVVFGGIAVVGWRRGS
jgi:CBS-domain-containing membrane protein